MSIKSNTLLFKLSKEGSERSHYLFGTMHISNETTLHYYSKVLPILQKCGSYFGELDFNEIRQESESVFSFQNHENLSSLLGSKFARKAKIILKKHFDIDYDEIEKLHPIYVSSLMAQKILSPNGGPPMDMLLFSQAMKYEMKTGGLESVAFQEELAKSIAVDGQLKILKSGIRNISNFRKQVKNLDEAYAAQDLKKMYTLSQKSMGELRNKLIYTRNRNMADKVVEIINDNQISTFMCCGAAHFWGEFGMLRHIKNSKGIQINAVKL